MTWKATYPLALSNLNSRRFFGCSTTRCTICTGGGDGIAAATGPAETAPMDMTARPHKEDRPAMMLAWMDGDGRREAARITAPRAMKVSRLMVLEVRDVLTVFSTFRVDRRGASRQGTGGSLAKPW